MTNNLTTLLPRLAFRSLRSSTIDKAFWPGVIIAILYFGGHIIAAMLKRGTL